MENNKTFKEIVDLVWKSKAFNIWMDICRMLIVVFLGLILYTLITEIETVKILGSNVCELCMNKTGAVCYQYANIIP